MVVVYLQIRRNEKRMRSWQFSTNSRDDGQQDRRKSRNFAIQALLFSLSFFVVYVFVGLPRFGFVPMEQEYRDALFLLQIPTRIIIPLQGFFYMLVYLRPRIKKLCRSGNNRAQLEPATSTDDDDQMPYGSSTSSPAPGHLPNSGVPGQSHEQREGGEDGD